MFIQVGVVDLRDKTVVQWAQGHCERYVDTRAAGVFSGTYKGSPGVGCPACFTSASSTCQWSRNKSTLAKGA